MVRCSPVKFPVCLFHGRLGAGLLCGVCAPRFVEGSFGLGLVAGSLGLMISVVETVQVLGECVQVVHGGSFRIRESLWRFGQSSGASELSSSDPQNAESES